jgi:hypothetical protein
MANFNSVQVTNDMPIPSHGDASSTKCQHFQVTLGAAGANADTINFGDLPDYAVPVEALIRSTGAIASITVGVPADPDGLFAGAAVTANVPLRSATGTLLGRNIGRGIKRVLGTLGGVAAVGTIDLFVFYVVEDQGLAGVGYPNIAAA